MNTRYEDDGMAIHYSVTTMDLGRTIFLQWCIDHEKEKQRHWVYSRQGRCPSPFHVARKLRSTR